MKEKEIETDEKYKRKQHREDVLAQIREKEKVKIHERNQFFEEGIKLTEEARSRRGKLEDVKKKKLDELRLVPFMLSCKSEGYILASISCFRMLFFNYHSYQLHYF